MENSLLVSGNPVTCSHKKVPWSHMDDYKLKRAIKSYGFAPWKNIAEHVPGRTDKQCRERWLNHLNPSIKNGDWSPEEDEEILSLYRTHGSRWSKLAKLMPRRTDNAIKNRFHVIKKSDYLNNDPAKSHRLKAQSEFTSSSESEQMSSHQSTRSVSFCTDSSISHGYENLDYTFQNTCCFYDSKNESEYHFQQHQEPLNSDSHLKFNIDCFNSSFEDNCIWI